MSDRVVVCIGTKNGLFVAESGDARGTFSLRGPFGEGVAVYSALIDSRGTPHLYASSCNACFGMKVLCSTDLGRSFKSTQSAPAFPRDDGRAVAKFGRLKKAITSANSGAVWSLRRCFAVMTAGIPGN